MIKASEKKYILLLPLMLMLAFACSIKGSAEVGSTAVPDDAAEFESHYYKVYTDVSGFEKASAEKAEGRISFTSEIQVMHTQNVPDFAFY